MKLFIEKIKTLVLERHRLPKGVKENIYKNKLRKRFPIQAYVLQSEAKKEIILKFWAWVIQKFFDCVLSICLNWEISSLIDSNWALFADTVTLNLVF